MAQSLKAQMDERRQRAFLPERRRNYPWEVVRAFAREADQLVRNVYEDCARKSPQLRESCIIALGGYGRGELCPYSDIDILVLHDGHGPKQPIEAFVQGMWDTGLAIGCVVRTRQECAAILGDDKATDHAFLESEYICGKRDLYTSLCRGVLRPHFQKYQRSYIRGLCRELHERVYSSANTLYRVEPDLKDGIFALRDCHRIVWTERLGALHFGGGRMRDFRMLGEEERGLFSAAYSFLLSLRIELHMQCKRRMDILEVGLQPAIAEALGFGADQPGLLMERYFHVVTDVKRCALSLLERVPMGGSIWEKARRRFSSFAVAPGIAVVDGILFLTVSDPPITEPPALWLLGLFKHAITCHAVLSIGLRNTIQRMVEKLPPEEFRNEQVDQGFRAILSRHQEAGRILELMHETRFLEAIIPEFGELRCQVEYDSYHEYTVDQHTLLAVWAMDDLAKEPDDLLRNIYLNLRRNELLRLALLLHDIGKALPGNHSRTGAIIAENIAERLGYSSEEIRRVRFLVYNHLVMSELSLHREAEEELIRDFAARVQDIDNLDMLYLLTVLDIRHVGSRSWTGWKAAQLRGIYLKTAAVLTDPHAALSRPVDEGTDMIEGSGYLRHALPEEREEHERWLAELKPGEIKIHTEGFVGFDRLTVLAHDRKGFLSDFVGCLFAEGLCILHAQINSTPDGRIVDVFNLECDSATNVPFERRVEGVRGRWRKISEGKTHVEDMVAERLRRYPPKPMRPSPRASSISIDNTISPRYTVLEVNVPESIGLLRRLVTVLAANEVSIFSASISTLSDQARDVFYLTDNWGRKVTSVETCAAIKADLVALFGTSPSGSGRDDNSRVLTI